MAPQPTQPPPKPTDKPTSSRVNKLPRIPKSTHITKRPLLHPPIPISSPSASTPQTIYIAPHTPFISAVKRVRSLLTHQPTLPLTKTPLPLTSTHLNPHSSSTTTKTPNPANPSASAGSEATTSKKGQEVILVGTGRAIEKVLSLGLFFQGQADCWVRVGTGSVGAVDDVVGGEEEEGEGEGEGETRVRRVSAVEVGVRLR